MNCAQARELLPALIYGDLVPDLKTGLEAHLATCAHCREEQTALLDVRRLLDLAPAPDAEVDVRRILAQASQCRQKQTRRWRRAAVGFLGVAAGLLALLILRLEVRWEGQQ